MKRFRERRLPLVGLISVIAVFLLVYLALEFPKLPVVNNKASHSAYFADAANLVSADQVWVYGVDVGSVTGLKLDGNKVKVSFKVDGGVHLGSATTAAIKVRSPIGTEVLELTPSGPGSLQGSIPLSRTSIPFTLVDTLNGFTQEVQGYDKAALQQSFNVSAQNLNATSAADTMAAFNGLARLSQVLGNQSAEFATIISQGAGLSQVLSTRSGQLFDLVSQSAIVLQVMEQRQAAIKSLLDGTTALSQQLTSFLSNNRPQLTTLFDNLQSVSAVLAAQANNLGQAIPIIAALAKYTANTTGSGPFADAAVPTLLIPDNIFKQCAAPGAFPTQPGHPPNPEIGCRP